MSHLHLSSLSSILATAPSSMQSLATSKFALELDFEIVVKRSPGKGRSVTISNTVSKDWLETKSKAQGQNSKWGRRLRAYNSPTSALAMEELRWYVQKERKAEEEGDPIDRSKQKEAWVNLVKSKPA